MIAPAVLPRWCAGCGQRMHPADPYAVTPGGGIGGDLIECLTCARDSDASRCGACNEPIEEGEEVYHGDDDYGCLPTLTFCADCEGKLTAEELGTVKCASCAKEGES